MEAIISALKEELQEVKSLIVMYEKELNKFPKGSFFVRTVGGKHYGYRTYSDAGEIKQKYLGKLSTTEMKKNKTQMERIRKLKSLLKKAVQQRDYLEKALRHAHTKS